MRYIVTLCLCLAWISSQAQTVRRFNYKIYPSDIVKVFSHSKSHAKKIRKVFDWSTAIIAFPPDIKEKAVNFELDMLRAKHTLINDGYQIGFITDKRK